MLLDTLLDQGSILDEELGILCGVPHGSHRNDPSPGESLPQTTKSLIDLICDVRSAIVPATGDDYDVRLLLNSDTCHCREVCTLLASATLLRVLPRQLLAIPGSASGKIHFAPTLILQCHDARPLCLGNPATVRILRNENGDWF